MAKRVLVVEWISSGGLACCSDSSHESEELQRQGMRMLQATCSEFSIAKYEVVTPLIKGISKSKFENICETVDIDPRDEFKNQILWLAECADWILIIAPETNNELAQSLQWMQRWKSKLLNPSLEFTQLASNKHVLIEQLAKKGVDVPKGSIFKCGAIRRNEVRQVVKPIDGCGGEGVAFFDENFDLNQTKHRQFRIEEFVPGTPASVSVIGGKKPIVLPALKQCFEGDLLGRFKCCKDVLSEPQKSLAAALARQTVNSLPPTPGFYGIDMVIGEKPIVIEVNPRITMSFEVLRDVCDFNLAERMIRAKSDFEVPF